MPDAAHARSAVPLDPPARLNVLLVGGGGREHALAWKLRQSPRVASLYTTHADNPGIADLAEPIDCPLELTNTFRLERFCVRSGVNLVVIGPEAPLASGLADKLAANVPGAAILGPGAEGARLESSKSFAKKIMRAAAIPTAEGRVFTDPRDAKAFLQSREHAYVVKASGLAAGKGVIVPSSLKEALDGVDRIMVRREFGDAGAEVVIEEKLKGREASVFALIDGSTIAVLETAQDYKRLGDGDTGPNTGGMGAVSPASTIDDDMLDRVQREVLIPLVDTLRREEIDFRGVLYVGLMLTAGGPKVLEFNTRFGDPECQALMPRLTSDLAELLYRTAAGSLERADITWDPRPSCCVVLAARGYPGKSETGAPITGIDQARGAGAEVFHASTGREQGALVSGGGRVLSVVALGDNPEHARAAANAAADAISFDGKTHRRDVGAGV
jgi:phosphoribosylamine--glycine ligase